MLKTGLKLRATLKKRNHHHSPSNSAGLQDSFGVEQDLSEEDTNPSWIGPNNQRCVDLANKVYDTCCQLILHSVPQNVDWTLDMVDSVLENHRLLRDIPLARVWRSTAESHHHRRPVSRARSRVQRAARLPWGCAPHGFATAGEVEYPINLCREWARVVVESICKKCNLAYTPSQSIRTRKPARMELHTTLAPTQGLLPTQYVAAILQNFARRPQHRSRKELVSNRSWHTMVRRELHHGKQATEAILPTCLRFAQALAIQNI